MRIRVEEMGCDDPPSDLHYELRLDFDTPDGEDTLFFALDEDGVMDLIENVLVIVAAEDVVRRAKCTHCGLKPCGCWDGTTRGARS